MSDWKLVDHSADGKVDLYMNGLGGHDGLHHDHHWNHVRQDGTVSGFGLVDRSLEREAYLRYLGGTALGGS